MLIGQQNDLYVHNYNDKVPFKIINVFRNILTTGLVLLSGPADNTDIQADVENYEKLSEVFGRINRSISY